MRQTSAVFREEDIQYTIELRYESMVLLRVLVSLGCHVLEACTGPRRANGIWEIVI